MLAKEWKAILKHKFFIIVIIALSLIPAIYNYIFLGSMWDPYGNLDRLPVAIVNQDRDSQLDGKKFSLGKTTISEMKKGKDLDYHFVSKDAADKGLESGKYYMKITFPENFSESAASLMTEHPKTVHLAYQTSRGHNYISSKMSESAMTKLKSKLSENITKSYTEALFSSMTSLKDGMKQAADGGNKLSTGAKNAQSGSQEISTNLDILSKSSLTFSNGTKSMRVGLNQYVSGVEKLRTGAQTLSAGNQEFSEASSKVAQGSQGLQNSSQQLLDGLSQLSAETTLSAEQKASFSQLENGLTNLNAAIQTASTDPTVAAAVQKDLQNVQGILPNLVKDQVAASAASIEGTTVFQKMDTVSQQEILGALQKSAGAGNVQADIGGLSASLNDVGSQLAALQKQTSDLAKNSNIVLPAASQSIAGLSSGLSQANIALSGQLLPGIKQFMSGFTQVNSGVQQLSQKSVELNNGAGQLTDGLNQLHNNSSQLTTGVGQLDNGAGQIASGSQQLNTGSQQLTKGLGSLNSGIGRLSGSLGKASQSLDAAKVEKKNADSVAIPLSTSHKDPDNVPVNGAGMAPYMISVALFIGALATNVVVGTSFSNAKRKNGWDFMLSKIGTNGVIALLQAIIVFGAIVVLGLRPNYPLQTLGVITLTSFAYMAIVTFFVTALGKVGDFLMIVLLVLQLATSAGTYPLQLAPKIYQVISPLLPMTYALKMVRQTIGLTGGGGAEVLLFIVLTLVFTLLLAGFKTGKASRFA